MRKHGISVTLWTAQVLLAALFIFAGVTKLVLPPEAMAGPVALPTLFLRFIGVMEILGAVGLLLPGLVRIRRDLTPIACIGLSIIMIGATVVTLMGGQLAPAFIPFAVGVIVVLVMYGRRDWLFAVLRSSGSGIRSASTSHASAAVRHAA
jgi:uncharacterized membrane protein YphA (DoxX/SURF4 family)